MKSYSLDLKLGQNYLRYIDQCIKFLSSSNSTRTFINEILFIDKNLLKNEYFIIFYYIEFMTSVKNLQRIDLQVIKDLISLDKLKFTESQHVDVRKEFAVTSKDAVSEVIEQLVHDKIDLISEMEEVTQQDFELAVSVLKVAVKDLQVLNVIYVSTQIFYEGYKIGKKTYKGREDYLEYMRGALKYLNELEEDGENVLLASKDNILQGKTSKMLLCPYPLPILNESWGGIYVGDSISVLASNNSGKTTFSVNVIAHALMNGVNVALFISELSKQAVISRIISVLGVIKYNIKLPSALVERYMYIEDLKKNSTDSITEDQKLFLQRNEKLINNVEYIWSRLTSEINEELGSLYIIEDLYVEDIGIEMENLKSLYDVRLLVVDHVNGIKTRTGKLDHERLNESYISLNMYGKRYGIANLVTNHITSETKDSTINKGKPENLRGKNSSESVNSPDKVIYLDNNIEMRRKCQFILGTSKDRTTNCFFEPEVISYVPDTGYIYQTELE